MRFNLKLDMIEIQPDSVISLKTFLQLMVEIYKCFSKEVFVIHGSDPHMRNLNPVRSWPNKRNSAKLLENMKSKPSWQILLPHARANINQHYLSEAT